MIDIAVELSVDYIKFQTFKAEKLVGKLAEKANYQKSNTNDDHTQYELLKNLELSHSDHSELIDYCNQKNIKFFQRLLTLRVFLILKI